MNSARPLILLAATVVLAQNLCGAAVAQPAAPPSPAVLVARAEQRPMAEGVELIGRVEALERVDIRARVTGFLRERTFDEGQGVKAGDLLFLIEHEPFEAEVASRQAQLEGARAALNNANLQATRGQELVSTNAIPRSTLDQRIADQQVAAAQVSHAQAALQQARIQLAYTRITTPVQGRVGLAALTPGNVVGPDSGVLTTVVRDDTDARALPGDAAAAVEPAAGGGRAGPAGAGGAGAAARRLAVREPGRISFINVTVDSSTDSTLVQAVVPNPVGLLTDRQVVGVRVETEVPREVVW